jgi:hypothetical protein
MKVSLRPPALVACSFRLFTALAAIFLATPGCGGLTTSTPRDGGVDAWIAPRQDAPGRLDSTVDAGSDSGTPDDAALSPVCAEVAKCCPQVPQVQLPGCMFTVRMNSSGYCQSTFEEYEGEISDAACDGSPTGTPACETLAACCLQDPNTQHCYQLVDAGNGPACTNEYLSLWNNMDCFSGPAP